MVEAGGTPKAASELRSASAWKIELVTGSHDFNVHGYSLVKGIGIGKFINSDAFVVGGYSWKIRFYPDGDRDTYKDYISVYLELLSDATDVMANFEATLFDQSGKGKHKKFRLFHVFGKTTSKSRGWGQFIERSCLEAFGYLKDDCLQFCGRVEVMQSRADDAITVPQSNIIQHFGELLASGEGVDVKFEVEGQTFSAHKLVLAARSPVFRAQFFGQMKDRRARCIKVEDMEAPVFKALLHFIYWDDLPNLEVEEVESKQTSTRIYGDLFAAANRYDLERLRLLCAAELRDNMTIDTVANTLTTLAEQHNCLPLKLACLKFIVQSNLQDAMERDDFKYLKETSPNLYIDMLEYISGINKRNIPAYNQGTEGATNESDGNIEAVVNESDGNELKRRKI